jgi:hypothetical protein
VAGQSKVSGGAVQHHNLAGGKIWPARGTMKNGHDD